MKYIFSATCAVKANVLKSLEITGYGMLAIFIVIAVLILLVKLMQYSEKIAEKRKSAEGYKSFKERAAEKSEKKRGRKEIGDSDDENN
ncbi:MAG: OadG family protein [Christensenellaceae bacterium]|nr:OadG family protein [Christensenellaceae bacterium]